MRSENKRRANERVLVVEDDPNLRDMLTEEIAEAGFQVKTAASAEAAEEVLPAWSPDLVVADLRLPGKDGIAFLRQQQQENDPPAFLMVTAFGTIPQAVEALKAGADHFLTKPLDLDHLMIAVERAVEMRRLKRTVRRFREWSGEETFHDLIGSSPAMRSLYQQIRQVARAEGPVVVIGESGVGKELVAKALHAESERRSQPFVPVNCASIPENLLASELFGHLPGAFTGAEKPRKGLFQEADGGVLFLDEITELPLSMQAKLLRVLQEGAIRSLGSDKETTIDTRVLVATNMNLEEEVVAGRFREDLFYRLETFQIDVPPLRSRGEDIELLAARFLSLYAIDQVREVSGFTPEAIALLRRYSFPGNVRELQNIVKRALVFGDSSVIEAGDLPERVRRAGPAGADVSNSLAWMDDEGFLTLEEMKTRYIHHVLTKVDGNKRRAAEVLGMGRRTLYRYLS